MNIAYNQDCLPAMREMPDNAFDLAVVDPPYGAGRDEGTGKYGRLRVACEGKIEWDGAIPSAEYFEELMRVSKNQIIFGGNYFPLPPSRGFVIWDKGEGFYNRDFAECELAWISFDANAKIFKYDPLAHRDYIGKFHPCQKPIALYRWIFQHYAKPGDKILDTHLGSGSSRIAAYGAGLDFVGYEIDKEYFDRQEERFAAHTAQISLFVT